MTAAAIASTVTFRETCFTTSPSLVSGPVLRRLRCLSPRRKGEPARKRFAFPGRRQVAPGAAPTHGGTVAFALCPCPPARGGSMMLEGKVALVTGARRGGGGWVRGGGGAGVGGGGSRGIGAAVARQLDEHGVKLGLGSRKGDD